MKSSPKVLFVSHEASRTGAPMFLLHLLRWLRNNTDLQFDLLLAKGGPLQEEFAKVTAVRDPKAFLEHPDQVLGYDLVYSNTVCNGSLLEEVGLSSVPCVTHVHELDLGYNWLGARAMAGVIRQSSRFVACAEAVATRMQQIFNLPAERFSVHYEMIDGGRVQANAAAADVAKLRRDYDLPEDAIVITGCGTFDLRKAPDLFVQLAVRVKQKLGTVRPLRFLWIGAQNAPDLVSVVREDIRKLGMAAEIRLISELPSPHGLIALSDLFCLTSREDPFPLVMLEAALLGKPVLCFEGAGGAREFCAAGGGLAVPYLDVPAMAELACELSRDPARRAEIGQRAGEVVRKRFTVEAVAPALWRELQGHLSAPLPLPAERDPTISLAQIFQGWNPDCWPQPAVIAAHLARSDIRGQARRLVAEGRKRDAVQLLVKAVGSDLATKHPMIVCEGLVEIAVELEALDPRQSAALLAKAREVSVSMGIKLAQFQPHAATRAAA